MSNLLYFQPREYRTAENRMILGFVPRDITEIVNDKIRMVFSSLG